jgi:hypothetical protein
MVHKFFVRDKKALPFYHNWQVGSKCPAQAGPAGASAVFLQKGALTFCGMW